MNGDDSVWHTQTTAYTEHERSRAELSRTEQCSVCADRMREGSRRMCMIAYPCYNIFTFLCYYFLLGRKSNASTPTVKPRLSKNICFYSLTVLRIACKLVLVVCLYTNDMKRFATQCHAMPERGFSSFLSLTLSFVRSYVQQTHTHTT